MHLSVCCFLAPFCLLFPTIQTIPLLPMMPKLSKYRFLASWFWIEVTLLGKKSLAHRCGSRACIRLCTNMADSVLSHHEVFLPPVFPKSVVVYFFLPTDDTGLHQTVLITCLWVTYNMCLKSFATLISLSCVKLLNYETIFQCTFAATFSKLVQVLFYGGLYIVAFW